MVQREYRFDETARQDYDDFLWHLKHQEALQGTRIDVSRTLEDKTFHLIASFKSEQRAMFADGLRLGLWIRRLHPTV